MVYTPLELFCKFAPSLLVCGSRDVLYEYDEARIETSSRNSRYEMSVMLTVARRDARWLWLPSLLPPVSNVIPPNGVRLSHSLSAGGPGSFFLEDPVTGYKNQCLFMEEQDDGAIVFLAIATLTREEVLAHGNWFASRE